MSKLNKNIISGLSGLLLGSTALTGVALAQDVEADATAAPPTVDFAALPVVNVQLEAEQSHAAPVTGSIVGTDVSVIAAGPIAADVIISSTVYGASGTANSATETILASAAGDRRAVGVAQTNSGAVLSETQGSLTGLDLRDVASGGMVVEVDKTTYVVSSTANASTAFNAGGALVTGSTLDVATTTVGAGTATALGEIAIATAQINTGTVESTLGGVDLSEGNVIGIDMTLAAGSITNTGGVIVSDTDASANATANTASSTVVDAVTVGDIDVAVATSQSSSAATTATAGFNRVGVDGVNGATITGAAPGAVSITVTGNDVDATAGGNAATHTITTRPGAAGDQVAGTISQDRATGANVIADNTNTVLGVSTLGTDVTGATFNFSGNSATANATGNSAAQDVTVDVGGVGGGGITTTTTQTSTEEDVDANSSFNLVGVYMSADGGPDVSLSGSTLLIDGNLIGASVLQNTASQSLGDVTGNITAPVAQTIGQTVGDGTGTTGVTDATAERNDFGVWAADEINNATVQISNNTNSSFAANNNAASLRGDLTGNISASVTQGITQTNDDIDFAAFASSFSVDFGVDLISDTALAQADGDVDLLITNNVVAAETSNNLATAIAGDITGVVSGAVVIGQTATQTNIGSDTASRAEFTDVGIGQSTPNAPIGTGGVGGTHTDLTISGNEVRALGRGNTAVLETGEMSGTLSGGAIYGVASTQTNTENAGGVVSSAGSVADSNNFGWIGQGVAHGIDGQDFNILVLDNVNTATGIDNVAANSVGDITGNVTDASVTAAATQTNQNGAATATANSTQIGIITADTDFSLGTVSDNVATYSVSGNSNAANSVGNSASTAVGDVTGTVSGSGAITATAIQTNAGLFQSSNANAAEIGVQAGAGTGGAGVNSGTVVMDVSNNTNAATTTGNEAIARLGDFTGTVSNISATGNVANTNQSSILLIDPGPPVVNDGNTYSATANGSEIGVFGSGVLGEDTQTVTITTSGNAVSATTQVNSATNIVDGVSGAVDGLGTSVGAANRQTASSATASATANNNSIGVVDLQGNIATGGTATVTAANNSIAATTGLNSVNQIVDGTVGYVDPGDSVGMGNIQTATPAAGAFVSATATVIDAQIGVTASTADRTITNGADSTAIITVTDSALQAGASSNDTTQTLSSVTGTMAGLLIVSSSQTLGAEAVVSSVLGALANPVGIGVLGIDDISGGANSTTNIAIAGNTGTSSASGNNLTQNIMPGGLTGTLAGTLQFGGFQTISGGNIDAAATATQIGLSHDGFAADTSSGAGSVTNVAVTGNGIGAAASGNTARLNIGDVTGTLNGEISLATPVVTQSTHTNADIDAALNTTGIGVDRAGSVNVLGGNAVTNMTVADNVQSASLMANDVVFNTGALVGALSGTINLASRQTNTLGTSTYSATILNSDTGIRIANNTNIVDNATFNPVVANNNTVASLVGNRSGVRLRELAVSGGGVDVNVGATQSNFGGTDPSFVASLGSSVETGVHMIFNTGSGINAIVSGNNSSADLIGNAAVTQFDDVGGVLAGSINVTDSQTNNDIFGNATVGDVFTQVDANSTGTLSVSSVLNDNRIGAGITGNLQVAQIITSGLSVGGVIGISGTQSNSGGAFRATVTGSIIGVAASAATSITGTSIVRGSTIGATAIGNSANASIR
ncbi:MAG: beta strand repeat-containing protein [Alphaproteobacteria bacterium]